MELPPAKGRLLWCLIALHFIVLCLADQDYCQLKCQGEQHTMCLYKEGTPGKSCAERHSRALEDGEKKDILDIHNRIRASVAAGNMSSDSSGPQPPAADMMQLVWDDELAAVAQRWANQCLFQHDKCRRVGRFAVGQNIAMDTMMADFTSNVTYSKIDMWVAEVDQLRPGVISKYASSSSSDHYTQLVWASTGAVGCGVSVYKTGEDEFTELLVCNYGPAGNMPFMPVYKQGPACSACPNGTECSAKYTGLCYSPDYANRTFDGAHRPTALGVGGDPKNAASPAGPGFACLLWVAACCLLGSCGYRR